MSSEYSYIHGERTDLAILNINHLKLRSLSLHYFFLFWHFFSSGSDETLPRVHNFSNSWRLCEVLSFTAWWLEVTTSEIVYILKDEMLKHLF